MYKETVILEQLYNDYLHAIETSAGEFDAWYAWVYYRAKVGGTSVTGYLL